MFGSVWSSRLWFGRVWCGLVWKDGSSLIKNLPNKL
ncbi:hypothetical protein [Escherichia phage vB_EcoM_ULIM9]|nr:hypothetical protein [Escherichia phage vB_EcoM_ULIM9]